MDRTTFEDRLRDAATAAIQFAREYVLQTLPDAFLLRVVPNCSMDENPRTGDEEVFPDDELPAGDSHGPWGLEQAVEFLWRSGKVPEWIDVSVVAADECVTVIQCLCCGRFTGTDELLYHRSRGIAPFSVKSPIFPPNWDSVEVSGQFELG